MILADANVLIYAFRSDSENHSEHKSWLESVVNGSAAYGISPQVLGAVVRVCTHPKNFRQTKLAARHSHSAARSLSNRTPP